MIPYPGRELKQKSTQFTIIPIFSLTNTGITQTVGNLGNTTNWDIILGAKDSFR